MPAHLPIEYNQLAALCQRWKITRFELFGSILRDDFSADSDVDVLVTFATDAHWSLFDFIRCKHELEAFFGRRVDLLTRAGVEHSRNASRRKAILQSAEAVYAA